MARASATAITAATSSFSEDGKSIAGRWEMEEDGRWKTDFEATYTKVE